MALTRCNCKCLFSIILLQTTVILDVTAVTYHHQSQRSLLAVTGTPVEAVTDNPVTDPNLKLDPNVTNEIRDHHIYYNSSFYSNPDVALSYWVDLKRIPNEKIITHKMLSDSHRRAAGVTLSFDFPFYGHLMRNITIATGGFLYMGDYMHKWIAATQYIAPLMANFDPRLHELSTIQYYDNGTAFTVQWDNVLLQDRSKDGSFTFQATLLQNGDIIFVYKEIPIPIFEISNASHPVKVGCSDAYVMERQTIIFRKKIIYEYHRLDQKYQEISNNTAIYLTALPTCLKYKDCDPCINADIGFNCTWCEAQGRCSDGLDRYRQEWTRLNCPESNNTCPSISTSVITPIASTATVIMQNMTTPIKNATIAPFVTVSPTPSITENPGIETPATTFSHKQSTLSSTSNDKVTVTPFSDSRKANQEGFAPKEDTGIGAGGIFVIVLVVTLILGIAVWILYAYKNPHSSSGQFLIKYRPSQWHWKTEESRYSASVHM